MLDPPPFDANVGIEREPTFLCRIDQGSRGCNGFGQIAVPNPRADADEEADVFERLGLQEEVILSAHAHVVSDVIQRLHIPIVIDRSAGVIDAAAE